MGRHVDSELPKSFRCDIQDDRYAVILKIFKQHLLRTVSQIEPKLSERRWGDMEMQTAKIVPIAKMDMAAILKIFKRHLLPNGKTDLTETWLALGRHGNSELIKPFRSDIRDGSYDGHLENF